MNCDYRLMIDNLMDLTHETYVHASSIGQTEIEEAAPDDARSKATQAITSRFMHNIMAPPFWRAALRGNGLRRRRAGATAGRSAASRRRAT